MTHLQIRGLLILACIGTLAHAADLFEVAAIRENRSGSPNTQIQLPPGGRLVVTNASVKTLIRNAYGLLSFQFAGGPNWLDDARFDINAKTGREETITADTLQPLLKSLLQERFQLHVHWEIREAPLYALLVGNTGPKLRPPNTDGGGKTSPGMNTRKGPGKALMRGTDVSVSELATNLGNQLGRNVIDLTGLTAHYDFALEWDPDQSAVEQSDKTTGPSLFTAVREQLGLKLDARKGPVKVLVVDSVALPSEN